MTDIRTQNEILREVLRAYEAWEADMLLTASVWETNDGLPHLTQELHDRLIELQTMRNNALRLRVGVHDEPNQTDAR